MVDTLTVGWLVDGYMHVEVAHDKVEVRRHFADHVAIDQYVRDDRSRIRELEKRVSELEMENGRLHSLVHERSEACN